MSCRCDFGSGLSTCHCAACHRTFTSPSAFGLHQRFDAGQVTCLDPAVMTMRDGAPVMAPCRKTPDGKPIWGKADARTHPRTSGARF